MHRRCHAVGRWKRGRGLTQGSGWVAGAAGGGQDDGDPRDVAAAIAAAPEARGHH